MIATAFLLQLAFGQAVAPRSVMAPCLPAKGASLALKTETTVGRAHFVPERAQAEFRGCDTRRCTFRLRAYVRTGKRYRPPVGAQRDTFSTLRVARSKAASQLVFTQCSFPVGHPPKGLVDPADAKRKPPKVLLSIIGGRDILYEATDGSLPANSFSVSNLDALKPESTPAVLSVSVEPRYPAAALAERIGGVLVVLIKIDATGAVTHVVPLRGERRAFSKSVVEAVKQWRFEPATEGGKPVASRWRETFYFEPAQPGAVEAQ
jgi:TonB family protein